MGLGEVQGTQANRLNAGTNARGFDEVMGFFTGGVNFDMGGRPNQNGCSTPTTNLVAAASAANQPSSFQDGLNQPAGYVSRVATSDTLSNSDLVIILRVLQQCLGDFPTITLRSMAERPEDLREWKYAVATSLKAAGPHVQEWWTWVNTTAELTHKLYARAPIMAREGIAVGQRTPGKFLQLECWIRPKLISCLPENLKRQLTQRGIQGGVDDEC